MKYLILFSLFSYISCLSSHLLSNQNRNNQENSQEMRENEKNRFLTTFESIDRPLRNSPYLSDRIGRGGGEEERRGGNQGGGIIKRKHQPSSRHNPNHIVQTLLYDECILYPHGPCSALCHQFV